MVTLKEMYHKIGCYLALYGDKDVTSIGTSMDRYILNLHDIHNGSIGTNPYTGASEIVLMKETESEMVTLTKEEVECFKVHTNTPAMESALENKDWNALYHKIIGDF